MSTFGGLNPFPRTYGGRKSRTETIVKSLQSQLAPKYDVTDTKGIVWLRINAMARVLAGAWAQNERLSAQWDPKRMSDFLPRWERIFGLSPSDSDSLTVRRARVGARMALAGFATRAALYALCSTLLGDLFVGIVTQTSATANVVTPSGWPMGSHPVPGSTDGDWYSTISHIVVLVQKPSAMDEGTFRQTLGTVVPELDAVLPSWATFNLVCDGPSGNGFFLDTPRNSDFQRLRV